MIEAESTSEGFQVSTGLIVKLGVLFFTSLILCLWLFGDPFNPNTGNSVDKLVDKSQNFGDKPNKSLDNSVDNLNGIKGESVVPYIQDNFQLARWYSLIESVETEDDRIILKTYIFPDAEGRALAQEINHDLKEQGVSGEILVYGRNVEYFSLMD